MAQPDTQSRIFTLCPWRLEQRGRLGNKIEPLRR